ncbi:MFS transporter [Martelella soudanensis]|uniref:MFS transporter n=1 Tax=unclassified Martelella TaxID=2629616 RepID=UPI0015DE3AF1|nr:MULTISPECIES: MFS transporter [unclassified Martelella]
MTVTASERNRALFLGSMGGGLEFYDFVIYASFASQIGKTFFPDEAAATRLLAAFAIFAVGYLVRPIGGILFSHFGDRYGRKAMLRISIAGMAGATFVIAFLPGYASWGISATVLLVLLRMVQGLCLGGEIPGAMTLITETMPKRRGLACGFLFMIINVGMLVAQAVQWSIEHLLSEAAVLSYGWRIGFFVGGLVAIAGFFLRARLSESPAFAEMESHAHKVPLAALFRNNGRAVWLGLFITGLGAAAVPLLYLYMNSYLTDFLKYDPDQVATAVLVGIVLFSLPMPVAGLISDFVGIKIPAFIASLTLAVAAIPAYVWMHQGVAELLPAMVVISLIASFAWGVGPVLLTAIFPTDVRYTGVAFVYNIGFAIVGGLTPLTATFIIQQTGFTLAPGFLLALFAGLAAVAIFLSEVLPSRKTGRD